MVKSADWDRIQYEFELYRKSKAFKRHLAIVISAVVLGIGVLVTRWALTSGGPAASMRKARETPMPGVPRELRGSQGFARTLASRLEDDPRFRNRVVAVPTISNDHRSTGRVMIQGQVSSDADLAALRDLVQRLTPTVPIDWQVLIVEGRR